MNKRILIVEDQEINRMMLAQIVSSKYEVIEAANGKEAMEILEQQSARIALILLDLVMPVMTGYEVLEEMKKNPEYDVIPIIITTNSASTEDELRTLSCGATEFIAKPYQPEILLRRIESILKLQEATTMVHRLQNDQLTGLLNRDYFLDCAQKLKDKYPEKRFDLFCSNVEKFRIVNEKYGVDAGDRFLKEVASVIKEELADKEFLLARFYADYFIGIAKQTSDASGEWLTALSEKVNQRFSIPNVSVKWGLVIDDGSHMSIEEMCNNAIEAVHAIRGQYEINVHVYNTELKEKLLQEQAVLDELDEALEKHYYEIYLQPKVKNGALCWMDAEALVRCNHPEKGMIMPDAFIPILEKTRLITKLDWYVWEETCKILRLLEDKGYGKLSVSVNVSRVDVYEESFVDKISELALRYRIQPSQLHLEITESAVVENLEWVSVVGGMLRERGFQLEIDDFGNGYSSLNMITQLAADVLKLDRMLVENESKKPGSLQFIIGLAHWLEMKVVAEGVETKEQYEHMFDIGCDYIQGYYAAKPMPWKEFEKNLQQQKKLGGG
ncbi:MAG: EAL domain-containing protein [Clostridiales bacterium]|nr:EAL domain-containing protein [Clostridiales bacterium]